MKGMLIAAGTLAVLATAGISHRPPAPSEAVAIAPADSGRSYRLTSTGSDASCIVVKGAQLKDGVSEVAVDVRCSEFLPELSSVRYWRDNSDGSVAFAGLGRAAILEFALSDGFDYESFRPGAPLVSLVAAGD
ncbi:MAG: hypothetical protein Q8Q62_07850 [Mesorhizobium sp.]|nr:hypothetical protein [Mesorhizobium sp.]